MSETFLGSVTRAFFSVLEPISSASQVAARLRFELGTLGWSVDKISAANQSEIKAAFGVADLYSQAQAIASEFDSPNPDEAEIARRLIEILGQVLDAFRGPGKAAPNLPFPLSEPAFWTEFVRSIVDGSISRFIETEHPVLYGVARIAGLIEVNASPLVDGRSVVETRVLRWDRLETVASGFGTIARVVYQWGDAGGFAFEVFERALMDLLWGAGIRCRLVVPPPDVLSSYFGASNSFAATVREVVIPVTDAGSPYEAAFAELAVAVLPIPAPDGNGPPVGWSVRPMVTGSFAAATPEPGDATVEVEGGFLLTGGLRVDVRPGSVQVQAGAAEGSSITVVVSPLSPFVLIGSAAGSRLELDRLAVRIGLANDGGTLGLSLAAGALDAGKGGPFRLILDLGDADGFLQSAIGDDQKPIEFDAAVKWSSRAGFAFDVGSGMRMNLPVNLSIGRAVLIRQVEVGIGPGANGGAAVTGSIQASVQLGPVTADVEGLGAAFALKAPSTGTRSSFADVDLSLGLKAPTGVGIAIKAGPISGGGFISFKDGRYAGALELQIYSVAVKAFGVIDTKLPGGAPGFSFVIVISAEFQPIQLGLGFTLNGVGGLLGINRTLSEEGLNKAFAGKGLQQLLFPKNVTQDAPQIIEGLATVFPAAEDKQVFGPMAKLGWGTPNLVTADLALILSLPERVLTILGIVAVALPRKGEGEDRALVDLRLAVKGVLDFPKSFFSLNAGLSQDSTIGGFPVGGQMAMRLRWGDRPNFLLSMGGFNSAFRPPPDFPALQRMTVDLGIKGNPNITLAGYLAVTSNSVQVGGELDVSAHDYGITLNAFLKAEAIFVFSPFSFTATIDAGVHVDFHGVGFSVGLHGKLSGPSPWHIDAKVCASVWFVSACLPVSVTIGDEREEALLPLNPWTGSLEPAPTPKSVIGLRDALRDPRNWTPAPGSSTQGVVSLAQAPKKDPGTTTTLVDPLDAITVHQRVVPLETMDSAPIRRFGPVKSSGRPSFRLQGATMGVSETKLNPEANITDYFAPAQYFELGDTKTISSPSFERFVAGYTFKVEDETSLGSQETQTVTFQTFIIDSKIPIPAAANALSTDILTGMQAISPAALFGVMKKGGNSYVDFAAVRRFRFGDPRYVVTRRDSQQVVGVMTGPASKAEALAALEFYLEGHSLERGNLQLSRAVGGTGL